MGHDHIALTFRYIGKKNPDGTMMALPGVISPLEGIVLELDSLRRSRGS
jgi:hypothetical protein